MKLSTFNVIFLLTLCQTYGYYFGMDTPDVAKATNSRGGYDYNDVYYLDYRRFANQFAKTSTVTDTPEIAKAKAEHFAAHAAILQSNPSIKSSNFVPNNVVNPYSTVPSNPAVPDTPEVARAKAEHLAARDSILRSNPPTTTEYNVQNFEQPNSGFVDTQSHEFRFDPQYQYKTLSQSAHNVHFTPKSEMYQTDSPIIYVPNHQQHMHQYVQNQNSYNGQYINPAVPDTPEVAKAKAEHFAARDILYRSLPKLVENYDQARFINKNTENVEQFPKNQEVKPSYVSEHNYQEIQHNNPNIQHYQPVQVRPEYAQIEHQQQPGITYVPSVTTFANNVPYVAEHVKVNPIEPQRSSESSQILGDTLEVARARAEHYAAHAALGNTAFGGLKDYAVTQTLGDTPEVAKAKAEHYAAHIAARYQLL